MFRLQPLIICLVLESGFAKQNSSYLLRLPDILQYLCPGAKVCLENQTIQAPTKIFQPGQESCCTECSCSLDCEKTGNCCFPSKLFADAENGDNKTVLQRETSCLFLTTRPPSEDEKIFYQAYNMISFVPEADSCAVSKFASHISCGEQNVAPWGSLFPVYSKTKNLLYKNIACATLDGTRDAIPLNAILVCDPDLDFDIDMNSFVRLLDSTWDSRNGICDVEFAFKGDFGDLSMHMCYADLIDVCSTPASFLIPEDIGLTKEEVVETCASKLISPFKLKKMYANVFCYLCNERYFNKDVLCWSRKQRGPGLTAFTGLIDVNFVIGKKRRTPKACKIDDNEDCRPVFCPSGQWYDQNGKCTYPVKLWYNQEYIVNINLTTEEVIDTTFLLSLKNLLSRDISILKSPWPVKWRIFTVSYEQVDLGKKHINLFVQIENKIPSVKPEMLMRTVKEMIRQKWSLEFDNSTIVFNSNFMEFIPSDDKIVESILFENHTKRTLRLRYREVYNHMYVPTVRKNLITYLYFCDQLELAFPEFTLSKSQNIIFRNKTSDYLFQLQFSLIMNNNMRGARICIDDFGLYQKVQNAKSPCEINLVLIVITASLYIFF